MSEEDLVFRLRKRAEIRRQIQSRKSVQEGKPDRIAELLEEAASEIEEWRDCIRTSPTMEGPVYNGIDHSQMQRCWKRFVLGH